MTDHERVARLRAERNAAVEALRTIAEGTHAEGCGEPRHYWDYCECLRERVAFGLRGKPLPAEEQVPMTPVEAYRAGYAAARAERDEAVAALRTIANWDEDVEAEDCPGLRVIACAALARLPALEEPPSRNPKLLEELYAERDRLRRHLEYIEGWIAREAHPAGKGRAYLGPWEQERSR